MPGFVAVSMPAVAQSGRPTERQSHQCVTELVGKMLGERQHRNGENASRSSLSLPGNQEALIESALATCKPIVLVLITGCPLDVHGPPSMSRQF
jgi:hypothetical protein